MLKFIFLLLSVAAILPWAETAELRGKNGDGPPPLPYNPNDLYTPQVINTAVHGLHKCFDCQNIAVVGAGVSGLINAIELSMAGHRVTVYEASNQIGGRILTYRVPDKGYITELGAMRLPLKQHRLTNIYVTERYKLKVTPFLGYDPNTHYYVNGHRRTFNERIVPEDVGFDVYDTEKNKTAGQLWDNAMNSVKYDTYDELKAKYDKYSIQAYFIEHENMSRGAIDFISLMYNVDMKTSLIEMVRSSLILPLSPEYSQIDGGFDLLINEFERACNDVPDGRCTIYTSTRVKEVHYEEDPNDSTARPWVRLTIGENSTMKNFDSVIVTTTARAAILIEFTPRELFIDKYHAFRQLHYDCATKIVHSFSRQFWRDENIQGGSSITDLPIRFVFYNNFNTTADPINDGAFIITSYVWATDALLWSGLSKEQTCEKSLDNLIQLHNRLDIRPLSTGCEVKNWCTDPYSLGAYALFTPYQETNLHDELGKAIKNTVFFSGEHISLNHRWIEGAAQSSVRLLMHLQEEEFDVAIIGGHPLGLATALNLAKKWNIKRIVVLEREDDMNPLEVAPFHQVSDKYYLSQLGKLVLPMWRELESEGNMPIGSLLNTLNGFLYVGETASNMGELCRNLSIVNCSLLSPTEVINKHPFINVNRSALYLSESGFINVTQLLTTLRALVAKTGNILVRDKETFLNLKHTSGQSRVHIETSRGSLNASKVIFLPGVYTKATMETLGLNLSISLYELPSSIHFRRLPPSNSDLSIPTWLFAPTDAEHYAGYLSADSDYLRVEPRINKANMQILKSPYDRTNQPDQMVLSRTLIWAAQHLANSVDFTDTVVSTDTVVDSLLSDSGFILDFIPGFGKKLVLGTEAWSSIQYVPAFAEILAYLIAANESSVMPDKYTSILSYFSVNITGRIILSDPDVPHPLNGAIKGKESTFFNFLLLLTHLLVILIWRWTGGK